MDNELSDAIRMLNRRALALLEQEQAKLAEKPKRKRWFESYRCGCVSEYVARKKDLPGYCPKHGDDRAEVHHAD